MNLSEIYENIMMALQALSANKLRALLTTLGIVIGVAATIAITTLTEGMNKNFTNQVETMGLNFFQLLRDDPGGFTIGIRERKPRPRITLEDCAAVTELCPNVGKVVPTEYIFAFNVTYLEYERRSDICGTVPEYQEVEGYYIARGRFISHDDVERRRMVCVLGSDVVDDLFPHEEPIGKRVTMGGLKFQVIGVLQEKGEMLGQNPDIFINIPVTTFEKHFGRHRSINTSIEPIAFEKMDIALEEVRQVMRQRHKLRFDESEDFYVGKNDQILKTFEKITGGAFMAVIGVTALSLLVGSIGIMNIMLVSVTERTREIGIRKAIGARNSDILLQFLVEAVILSVIGGIIGILTGIGIGMLASTAATFIDYTVPVWVVLLGVTVSAGVGIVSGFYPAYRAAKLDPIESLRYE